MSLPWVKVRVSIVDNDTFKALSPGAKLTFYTALCLAQKQDRDGDLYIRGIGPMTAAQLATYTGMSAKRQQEALSELCGEPRLLSQNLDGCYHIERFDEMAGEESARKAHAARQRRWREKKRDGSDASHAARVDGLHVDENVTDIELDIDREYELLRNSALAFSEWPSEKEIKRFQNLATVFIRRFANCQDPKKIKGLLQPYSSALAVARTRGNTIEQAWRAVEQCWEVGGRVPLFRGTIKSAISFLPQVERPRKRGLEPPGGVHVGPDWTGRGTTA